MTSEQYNTRCALTGGVFVLLFIVGAILMGNDYVSSGATCVAVSLVVYCVFGYIAYSEHE